MQHPREGPDLTEHATQPQFVHVHRWRPWDFVMWDNRRTMHRVRRYDDSQPRDMRRTTLAGDTPTVAQQAYYQRALTRRGCHEPSRCSLTISELAKSFANPMPATKPPTCAQNATPPPSLAMRPNRPLTNCRPNQ